MDTSNIYRYMGQPYDNWTSKDGKLLGYYPRNSLINGLSKKDSGIGVYENYFVIRSNIKVICRNAFRDNKRFGIGVISDGVEIIEEYAFYNMRIKEITIPPSVKHIRKNSFSKDMTLFVYPDTYGERYAKRYGYTYKYVDLDV